MKNYSSIILLQIFIECLSSALLLIGSWVTYATTESALYTGLYVGFSFVPSLVTTLFIGVVLDRTDPRRVVLIAVCCMAASLLLLLTSLLTYPLVLLFAAQLLLQVAGTMFRPAVQVYMTLHTPRSQLSYLFAKAASFAIVGSLAGTLLASQLLGVSRALLFVLLASVLIAAFLLVRLLQRAAPREAAQPTSPSEDLRAGWRYVRSQPFFVPLFTMLSIGQVITHSTTGFLAAFTYETFAQNEALYGYLQLAFVGGGITLGLLTNKQLRQYEQFFARYAFVLLALCLVSCYISASLLAVAIALCGIGFFTTWIRSHYQAVQQMHTPQHVAGKLASIRMLCNQGAVIMTSPLLGFIAAASQTSTIFVLLALLALTAWLASKRLVLPAP